LRIRKSQKEMADNVCKDFLNGVCNRAERGMTCKFDHPEGREGESSNGESRKRPAAANSNACRDFLNGECNRTRCKFSHDGEDPGFTGVRGGGRGGFRGGMRGGGRGGFGGGDMGQSRPACKDFLNKKCDRGERCRFRHATEREMQLEEQIAAMQQMQGMHPPPPPIDDMYGKRPRIDDSDEVDLLLKKITDLKKQVLDLTTMNDALYEQNKQYRARLQGSSGGPVSYPTEAISRTKRDIDDYGASYKPGSYM